MTRRAIVGSAAALALAGIAHGEQRLRGACDTHVHVLDPARFPYSAKRRYTPGPATVTQLVSHLDQLGMDRVVVAQNSVYGTDSRCVLDAISQLGMERARGIAVVSEDTTSADLAALDGQGIRGTRLNLEVGRDRNVGAAEAILRKAIERLPPGWHVHINAALPVIAGLSDAIASSSAPVVFDHFAHAEAAAGVRRPGFERVLNLLRSGRAYVKLSGPYQISKRPGYDDIASIARAYVDVAPDRVMWGSDWPHTGGAGRPADQPAEFVEPFRQEDDPQNLALLTDWVPDPALRRRILVDTPAAVYGFAPAA